MKPIIAFVCAALLMGISVSAPTVDTEKARADAVVPEVPKADFPDLTLLAAQAGDPTRYCALCHEECPGCWSTQYCPADFTGDDEEKCTALQGNFDSSDAEHYGIIAGMAKADACNMYCTPGEHCPTQCATDAMTDHWHRDTTSSNAASGNSGTYGSGD